MMTNKKTFSSKQRGIGLIDVMVAIFIFSIGLLAIFALQLTSKQSNYEAIQRSHATDLTYGLFERMRMNSGFVTSTSIATPALSYYVNGGTLVMEHGSTLPATADCTNTGTPCSYQQLADWDLVQWQKTLRGELETSSGNNVGGLAQPTACLSGSGISGKYTLTIAWRGQTRLDNQSSNSCGNGLGLYDESTPNDHKYRRILELSTYLNN